MRTEKENRIKYFFRQTFRRHTGSEYSELLTRGMHGEKGVNRKHPWAYCRLFALIFILLAVFLLIVRFTYNELFSPTIIVLASTCFNLSFLLFLYELYPERDLSFLAVTLAVTVGGAAANVVSQILFDLFPPPNEWLTAVYSGFFEELPKAAATLAAIVISRKRSPLSGFMFGAAVGCGFSVVEDMGYIFISANEISALNLTTVVEIAFSRGATALCTHTLWTGAIGWAFNHEKKYLANIVLYPMLLLSCGLHIAWDLPLPPVALGFVYAGCAVVALTETSVIIARERKKVFSAAAASDGEEENSNADEDTLQTSDPEYWSHWGHVSVVVALVLMAVIADIYCSIPFRERYGTATFGDPESFISYMQDGADLNAGDRDYDYADSANDTVEGEYTVQTVGGAATINGRECTVEYTYKYYGGVRKYLHEVSVSIDDGTYRNTYFREQVYNKGELYASFFRLTDDEVTGWNFDRLGDITVFIYDADYVRDLTDMRYLWLFCTFAAIVGAASVCYISLKIKSWRVKKLCSTDNASSAK